jgi:hypothetical protein
MMAGEGDSSPDLGNHGVSLASRLSVVAAG